MSRIGVTIGILALVLAVSPAFAQPPAPTNLQARLDPGVINSVGLTWQATSTALSFRIYRSVEDTNHFAPIATTNMHEFHDHGVMPGHMYFYFVTARAMNGGLESPPSNIASIALPPPVIVPRGMIAGTVIDDSTLSPIRNVTVRFYRQLAPSNSFLFARTDSMGHYQALLDTGHYLIQAVPPPTNVPMWRSEWFDDAPTPQTATLVTVAESTLFVANFGLGRFVPPSFAYISGTVTDSVGTPLRHAQVAVLRTMQEMSFLAASFPNGHGLPNETASLDGLGHTSRVVWKGWTDSLGNYRARVISEKSYIALASKPGYLPEYFNNKTNPNDADILSITNDTAGIDFSLNMRPVPQNSIAGLVRDSLGTGVPSRIVLFPARVNSPSITPGIYGHTDSLGAYLIERVPEGKYFVFAMPFTGYAPAYYKAGAYGVIHRADADTVEIAGNITGIDVGVVRVNSIGLVTVNGRVRSSSGMSIQGASIFATAANSVVGYTVTDEAGYYSMESIPSGNVTIEILRDGYNGYQGTLSIDPSTYTVSGVDYTLSPSGVTSVGSASGIVPETYALNQNYPNPFNPSTTVSFNLPAASRVTLKVYNLLGQEIATLVSGEVGAGTQTTLWNGDDQSGRHVTSGVYFYKLRASPLAGGREFTQVRKMLLMK